MRLIGKQHDRMAERTLGAEQSAAMPSATASGYAMAFESFSALTIPSFVREDYTSIVLNGQ